MGCCVPTHPAIVVVVVVLPLTTIAEAIAPPTMPPNQKKLVYENEDVERVSSFEKKGKK